MLDWPRGNTIPVTKAGRKYPPNWGPEDKQAEREARAMWRLAGYRLRPGWYGVTRYSPACHAHSAHPVG